MSVSRTKKLVPHPSLCTKITWKFMKDYNIKPGTLKLLEKGWEVHRNREVLFKQDCSPSENTANN